MKVFFPAYYKEFTCKAGDCRHSCCIGWEIGIDGETLKGFEATGDAEIMSHIHDGCIMTAEDGRCPFLRPDGLCRLIARYGHGFVSEICREHPRFYHRMGDRVEMGIGASCEEAARLILSSDYRNFDSTDMAIDLAADTRYDALAHRERIYHILSLDGSSFDEKADLICREYGIDQEKIILDDEALCDLEMLEESNRELIFGKRVGEKRTNGIYSERFFAYLVFRHLSCADSPDNLHARLGFCLYLTRLFEGCALGAETFDDVCEAARIISQELEYSEDNTDRIIFEFECIL